MSKAKVTSDFIVNCLCGITIVGGAAEFSINVILNSYLRRYKEEVKDGKRVLLNELLRKRFDNVMEDLKFTDFQKAFASPFPARGLNPINIGCLNSRAGCHIGIPATYNLNSIDDIENIESQEHIQLVNDNSESGQKFMETLILSEPAKKFSIARELILTDNYRVFIKSISLPITLIPMYIIGHNLLHSLPSISSFKIRAFSFFVLCNVGVFVWLFARKTIEHFYQINADKKVCNTSEEYTLGGIEYYEKLIKRNLALRNIIPDGQTIYSEEGNELGMFSGPSLTYRKKLLETQLQKSTSQNNNEK